MSRTNCYERLISIARQQSFTCCSTTPATYCVPLTEKLKRFLDYKYSRKDMKDIFEKFTSSSPKIIPVSTSMTCLRGAISKCSKMHSDN